VRHDEAGDEVGIAVEAAQPSGAAVGRVEDTGKRVLVGALDPCGQCDVCRRGGCAVCPHAKRRGGPAPRMRVASRWLVGLGDGLELPVPAAAAVAGDVAIAYTLYARTGLQPRDPAVVTGATGVTRFLVEILLAKSITPTVVADERDRAWCEWLVGKGAAVARDEGSVAAAIATQGLGARPWRVLATEPATVAMAAALAGPRATLTILAGDHSDVPAALLAREVAIVGVAGAHPDLVVEVAAMCAKGEIDLAGGTTSDASDRTRAHVISF
jgi:D-arabinose 1-dehydrogenase-like Zn-dependent alcohol dehydrogenase